VCICVSILCMHVLDSVHVCVLSLCMYVCAYVFSCVHICALSLCMYVFRVIACMCVHMCLDSVHSCV
jgi:hypothetical protein